MPCAVTAPPSASLSRSGMISSTSRATPPRSANARERTRPSTSRPIPHCWGWRAPSASSSNCIMPPMRHSITSPTAAPTSRPWAISSSIATTEIAGFWCRIAPYPKPCPPMPRKFTDIPQDRPITPLLDNIGSPGALRTLDDDQLLQLADELRAYLLYAVSRAGGHFGAELGVIELTVALHYVFNTPDDRLVWDVGHQTYPHKILTGRRDAILNVRQEGGISGFPKRSESPYDTFGVGHSSTSISAALGMAIAARMDNLDRRVVAVIGDGAMTAGMAFEALNHTAHTDANLLVVLNDNNMSISRNVGGLATYFSRLWASRFYNSIREGGKKALKAMPSAAAFVRKTEEHLKAMVAPGIVFEELGFNYIGPIDGHDLPLLVQTLSNLKDLNEPVLLHTITRKGQGFVPAEQDPIGYHALNKIEPAEDLPPPIPARAPKPASPKYQDVFG